MIFPKNLLDNFNRAELIDFVTCTIHSLDTPPDTPKADAEVPSATRSAGGSADHGAKGTDTLNTFYLAQSFLSKAASFSSGAPAPDDLFTQLYGFFANLPEKDRLGGRQLREFAEDYSSMTREQAVRANHDLYLASLFELRCARVILQDAAQQHDAAKTARTAADLKTAQEAFGRKRDATVLFASRAVKYAQDRTPVFLSSFSVTLTLEVPSCDRRGARRILGHRRGA